MLFQSSSISLLGFGDRFISLARDPFIMEMEEAAPLRVVEIGAAGRVHL